MNHDEYKLIFFEILNGFSSTFHSYFQSIFIKHLSYIEVADLDIQYNLYLNNAINKGILTYKQKENQIVKDGFWDENDEIELLQNEKFIQDLRINLSKEYLFSRRLIIKNNIEDAQNKLTSLRIKKSHYIGVTAEDFANKKLTYYRIINSFFKDKTCHDLLIREDDIDDEKYDELIDLYNKHINKLNVNNLRKIALSTFFTNIFYLAENNAYSFYGKSIIELTDYQTNLFLMGRYFKNILSQHQEIPKDILSNPDDLMEWLDIQESGTKAGIIGKEDENTSSTSILGATKKDMEMLGLKPGQLFNLNEKLKNSGGKLTAEDLYKLHNS